MITKYPIVLNRSSVTRYKPEQDAILISITAIENKFPFIVDGRYIKVLRLKFDDIKQEEEGFVLMDDQQASKVASFAKWANSLDKDIQVVVNCDAGISRSAATAAAISKYFLDDDMKYFNEYRPNPYVYTKILKKLHESS